MAYLLNLNHANLFFLLSVKMVLASLSLATNVAEKAWEGVTIPMDDIKFATTFRLVVSSDRKSVV